MTSQGETLAAWVAFSTTGSRIETSVRPAGGSFGPPAGLGPLGEEVENLDLTTDPAGNSILTWRRSVDAAKNDIRLYYSYRPAGGAFTVPREVTGAGVHVALPTTAMDAAGNALTVFARAPGGDFHLAYVFRPAGGEYGDQREISSTMAQSPQVEFAADGTAIAAWTAGVGGAGTDRPGGPPVATSVSTNPSPRAGCYSSARRSPPAAGRCLSGSGTTGRTSSWNPPSLSPGGIFRPGGHDVDPGVRVGFSDCCDRPDRSRVCRLARWRRRQSQRRDRGALSGRRCSRTSRGRRRRAGSPPSRCRGRGRRPSRGRARAAA